jgi:hypothetical protein
LFQTAGQLHAVPAISESETAFLVMHARPNARATQHRSCCKATGWTWPESCIDLTRSQAQRKRFIGQTPYNEESILPPCWESLIVQSRFALGLCLPCLLILLTVRTDSATRAEEPARADVEFFEKEVRPLLIEHCSRCHGDAKTKGGLKLTSRAHLLQGGDRGPAIVAGKPDESLLLQAVRYQDQLRMPPSGKLTPRQIETLTRWVKLGAPWPGTQLAPTTGGFTITEKQRSFWSFQPVKQVVIPTVRNREWPQTNVDRFILAALEARGLAPSTPADKRTLLRRATFDLTGLPPTPAEIDAFLTDDSPQAFARVVDRLLASPRYGERWGRHWLDVVRYADARDLIQLPEASDFREAWRYRDWVVNAFNRDMPYTDFVRHQIAGDLLPSPHPGEINRDGIIATGFLAIADFVPGDVDKEQMIADYVNDQIDVVTRGFLGISVACARCHDHKFDPIATEDYYGLAGIFFSTRLIPGPVPGNTPLVRVPLVSAAEQARDAEDKRRRAELERLVPDAADREYLAYLKPIIATQTAKYLVAAGDFRRGAATLAELAKEHGLNERLLAGWVAFLGRVEKLPAERFPTVVRDAASGKLTERELKNAADKLQQALAAAAIRRENEPPEKDDLARAALLRLRADDPRLDVDAAGKVTRWPSRGRGATDARPPGDTTGPQKTTGMIAGHKKTVLRFDGRVLLETPITVPPSGSVFVVYKLAEGGESGQRLIGWEDANVGRHGLGLMLDQGGRIHAILRNNGQSADLTDTRRTTDFEMVNINWGATGATLHRNGMAAGKRDGAVGISSDPSIRALRLGGPGSGGSPRFRGDLAEIRVYNRPLSDAERRKVETELRTTWFEAGAAKAEPPRDSVVDLHDELVSSQGPFWVSPDERIKLLPAEVRTRLSALKNELETLRKKPPLRVEQAVAVQDGGPKGTRHEGFKDAQVYQRGDPKRPGKSVPRGFPRIVAGERQERITRGSGRLELADWLTSPGNPLPARVMVNRIWQHHFGEGVVRTTNDYGERGERPTNPELLDYLTARFIESGWSMKAMHRLIMLSAVYQQSSRADADHLTRDPENRLFSRMNRRRLEAEAIRDSLLAVAGRLDATRGGPAFTELTSPRRTLYLMSVRTGSSTSDFGRLFDRADPGTIVDRRTESVVAPQALFFLNDPAVSTWARDLAGRVAREAGTNNEARIRHLHTLVLGRLPTAAEMTLGLQLLTPTDRIDPWERYCHLILCANEFVFLD